MFKLNKRVKNFLGIAFPKKRGYYYGGRYKCARRHEDEITPYHNRNRAKKHGQIDYRGFRR